MAITPIDIQQHQFKSQLFGYDKSGVDRFLELVAEELERMHRQYQEVREDLSRTRSQLEEMRDREATLKETLMTAQRVTDDLRSNARKEAEIIIADARVRAEQIINEAERRRLQVINEIQELKRQKVAFESGLRSLVESHLMLLNFDSLNLTEDAEREQLQTEPGQIEDLDDFALDNSAGETDGDR
jgi:cell division initiation protein